MLPSFDNSYDNCCHRNFTNKIFPQKHIASLEIDLYASRMQYAERNKVTAYFCCKDKRLLGDFFLEPIKIISENTGCHLQLSSEATLYIADLIKVTLESGKIGNRLLGIPNNAMISLSNYQTIASYCPMTIPKAQSNLY